MARAVSVHEDTVNAWKRGTKVPRDAVFDKLQAHVVERRHELGFLLDQLAQSSRHRSSSLSFSNAALNLVSGIRRIFTPSRKAETAHAAGVKALAKLQRTEGPRFILGKLGEGAGSPLLDVPVDGNVITVAATRTGGTTAFISHLLAPGDGRGHATLAFDKNGEMLAAVRTRREQLGRKVVELPVRGSKAVHLNLLNTLVRDGYVEEDARQVTALLFPETGHFHSLARRLVESVIAYVFTVDEPLTFARLHLWIEQIRNAILGLPSAFDPARIPELGRFVASLRDMREQDTYEFDALFSVVDGGTGWMEHTLATASSQNLTEEWSTFDPDDLLDGGTDVFVTYSAQERERFAPWLRLLAAAPLIVEARRDPVSTSALQVLVGEADQLGNIATLPAHFRLGRTSKVRYWLRVLALQSLNDLYGEDARELTANAGALSFHGGATCRFEAGAISAILGDGTFVHEASKLQVLRPLFDARDIASVGEGEVIVAVRQGKQKAVFYGHVDDYETDAPFEGLADDRVEDYEDLEDLA
jgi:type IV secretory pathway TraG/TraD family ATPase VirD4